MKTSLRRRHAQMVRNGAVSHKIDFITLNIEGHQNRITGNFDECVDFSYLWSS